MEIVPTDYPEFFPCPTWQYGQGQASFTQRVPFDSGWVRQRRKFDDTYLSIDLSFIMSTAVYSRWSDWVNANGYDWFVIPLDRFEGEKKDFTIRFKSILNMAYDAYDRVIVTVSAEQYEGKPNPNKIYNPEGPPGPIEACYPYDCAAYEDYLTQLGIFYQAKAYTTAVPTLAWPFSTSAVGAGNGDGMRFYGNFIAGAQLYTDWLGTNSSTTQGISTAPTPGSSPSFCGGSITQMGFVDGSKEGAPVAIINTINDGAEWPWGDHAMEAVISGLQGTNNIQGSLLQNLGKSWNYFHGTQRSNNAGYGTISAGISTSGGEQFLNVIIGNGIWGYPDYTNSVSLGNISDDLSFFSASITSGPPEAIPTLDANPGNTVGVNATVTASCAGKSVSVSGIYILSGSDYRNPPEPISNISEGLHSQFTTARYLFDCQLNFAYLSGGIVTQEYDEEISEIEFARNFSDYQPPSYCSYYGL